MYDACTCCTFYSWINSISPHLIVSAHEQVTNDDGKEEWWLVKRLESATMKNWFFHLHSFLLPEEKPFWKKDKVLRNPFWESATLVKAKSRSCDIIFSWTLPFMEFSSLMSQLNLIKILTWTSVVQICNISDDRGSISFRGNRNAKSKTKSWNSGFFWAESMNCETEKRIVKHKSAVSPSKMSFFTTRTDCQMSILWGKFGQISILGDKSIPVTLCFQIINFYEPSEKLDELR